MKRRALETSLDSNPRVRQLLIERLTKAMADDKLPVAVLHQMLQVLELWINDAS